VFEKLCFNFKRNLGSPHHVVKRMKCDCGNVRQILIGYFEVPLVPEAFGQLPGLYHPIVILGAELMMWMLELHAEMEVPVISDPLVIAVG